VLSSRSNELYVTFFFFISIIIMISWLLFFTFTSQYIIPAAEAFNDVAETIMDCIIPNDVVPNACTRMRIQRENNDIFYQRRYFSNGLKTIKFASACQPCRRQNYYVSTAGERSRNFLSVFLSSSSSRYYDTVIIFVFLTRNQRATRNTVAICRIFYQSSRSTGFAA